MLEETAHQTLAEHFEYKMCVGVCVCIYIYIEI